MAVMFAICRDRSRALRLSADTAYIRLAMSTRRTHHRNNMGLRGGYSGNGAMLALPGTGHAGGGVASVGVNNDIGASVKANGIGNGPDRITINKPPISLGVPTLTLVPVLANAGGRWGGGAGKGKPKVLLSSSSAAAITASASSTSSSSSSSSTSPQKRSRDMLGYDKI